MRPRPRNRVSPLRRESHILRAPGVPGARRVEPGHAQAGRSGYMRVGATRSLPPSGMRTRIIAIDGLRGAGTTTLGDRLAGAVGASTTRLMVPDDGQPAGFVLLGEPARAARREAALPPARLRQRRGGASSCLTADMRTPDWSDGRSVFASTLKLRPRTPPHVHGSPGTGREPPSRSRGRSRGSPR